MIQRLRNTVLFAFSFLMVATSVNASNGVGVGHGGGGDTVAADFAKVAQDAIDTISSARPVYAHGFHIDEGRLQRMFDKSTIKSVRGPLTLNGKQVVAINYPNRSAIIIDRGRWPTLEGEQKIQIALHEFIGLTFPEISDHNYRYSRELTNLVMELRKSIKLHVSLEARKFNAPPEDYFSIGQAMEWVETRAKTDKESLEGFSVEFIRNRGYMTIKLFAPDGSAIFETKQFVTGLDFNTTINYPIKIKQTNYDQLVLSIQEALGRTPQ